MGVTLSIISKLRPAPKIEQDVIEEVILPAFEEIAEIEVINTRH